MAERADAAQPVERTTVSLPRALARKVDYEARRTGVSRSAIVRDALERYWADEPERPLPDWVGSGDSGRHDVAKRAEQELAEIVDERFDRTMGR